MSLVGPLGAKPVVYLAYSDESGSSTEIDQPIVVVAAVMIDPDSQWDAVTSDLDVLVETHVSKHRRADFEFHATELFAQLGRKEYKALVEGLFGTLIKHRLPIYYGAVHRENLGKQVPTWPPKTLLTMAQAAAFMLCASQVEQAIQSFRPGEKLLWIADNTIVASSLRMLHRAQQRMRVNWSSDLSCAKLGHIMDTIYFGDSRASRGLQLADACSFVIRSHLMGKEKAEPYYRSLHLPVQPVAFAEMS